MSIEAMRLKSTARRAYNAFLREMETHDCGITLLKEVCPRASQAARDFNAAMTELQKLDPKCPAWEPL